MKALSSTLNFALEKNEIDLENAWGFELLLDCRSCQIEKIKSRAVLEIFVKTLIPAIGMKAYGEPILEHFATHNPDAAGFSLMQFIETSSITGHFVDRNGDAYIDVFSCKYFDPEIVATHVNDLLGPEKINGRFLTRNARPKHSCCRCH